VHSVREIRNRYDVDARTNLDVFVRCSSAVAGDFRTLMPFITVLAGVGRLECYDDFFHYLKPLPLTESG
jgi:valyl-tRNA synthetase